MVRIGVRFVACVSFAACGSGVRLLLMVHDRNHTFNQTIADGVFVGSLAALAIKPAAIHMPQADEPDSQTQSKRANQYDRPIHRRISRASSAACNSN